MKIIYKIKTSFSKVKIPAFFKTKKFFMLLVLFIVFFLFTPISLHQISNRIEDFINSRAQAGLQIFERQTGLKIEWEHLNFNVLTMTVRLEGVRVIFVSDSQSYKDSTFHFLDGLQKVEQILARPSLYFLLFKKRVVLSKLQVKGGDIHLKTLTSFRKKTNSSRMEMVLPIKKILIKQTNLHLRHQDHNLLFSRVKAKILQKRMGAFRFNFSVKAFRIQENLIRGHSILNSSPYTNRSLWFGDISLEEQTFQLDFKGFSEQNRVSFKDVKLKNNSSQSFTSLLDIRFDAKGIITVNVKSEGTLPFFIIQQGLEVTGGRFLDFDSLLSYKLNIQYRRKKGYQGFFDIHGKNTVFKSKSLKGFILKGRLINYLLAVDRGLIETHNRGSVKLTTAQWQFKGGSLPFNVTINASHLSLDFLFQTIFDLESFPIRGDFTGEMYCSGESHSPPYLKCNIQGQSEKLTLKIKNKHEILSVYETNLNTDVEWDEKKVNFDIQGEKENLAEWQFKGQYLENLDKTKADYFFKGNLYEDLKFHTPFPIKGEVFIQEGKLIVEDDELKVLTGFIRSPLLKLNGYALKSLSSSYSMKNNYLKFMDIKSGIPGKSYYEAECGIDFKKDTVFVKSRIPFFDVTDFLEAIKNNFPDFANLKGTGSMSLFVKWPWSDPEKKEFHFKGELFEVFINKDFFKDVVFDLELRKGRGFVHALNLNKGQGSIKGEGTFDSKNALNLNFKGHNLSLERLEWLNDLLPFNQSGEVNFDVKVTGHLQNPQLDGHVFIENMFFYSYPVKNSKLALKMDKSGMFFSGEITDKIQIEKFKYPFSKDSGLTVQGRFTNLDGIKILLSKDRKETTEDYFSRMTGSFSFAREKDSRKRMWTGTTHIDKILISKSNMWIKSDRPFSLFLKENKWSFTSVSFSHHNDEKLILKLKENNKLALAGKSFLGLFSVFFPSLKGFEGTVEFKDPFLMDNNLWQLAPRGSFQVEEGLFSIDPLPDMTDIKASFIVSKNNIFINNLTGSVGGGSFNGKGTLFYDFIHSPFLNLKLNFNSARFNIPEDFHTKGHGEISIKGNKIPYLIQGHYEINSGTVTKDFLAVQKKSQYDFSFLEKEVKEQTSPFRLNLNLKTNNPVLVSSSLIRSSVEGEADIYGPIDSLLMNGEFILSEKAEENVIFFRGQEFQINSGSILFSHSAPDNPYLNIRASTLFTEIIVDPFEGGQQEIKTQYNISIAVKGSAKKPLFSLESSPSLSEKEIISLLTLGVGSRHFDTKIEQGATDYAYQILTSVFLEKHINKAIKNTLGWDFRFTSSYVTPSGQPSKKVTLSRNWFEKWKTSLSQTIEDAQRDIRLRYSLSQRVFLTAFWENTGQAEIEDNMEKNQMGLDFEFQLNF